MALAGMLLRSGALHSMHRSRMPLEAYIRRLTRQPILGFSMLTSTLLGAVEADCGYYPIVSRHHLILNALLSK